MARIAVAIGAVGSIALMLRAAPNMPPLLVPMFVIWILAPFAALAWAHRVAQGWPALTRAALHWVTIVIALASLVLYAELIRAPAGSPRGFVFVAVPPASALLAAVVVMAAALVSRRSP